MPDQFVIASIKHTSNKSLHILWWRADWCGYTPVIAEAGLYTADDLKHRLNDGVDCIAIPQAQALKLGVAQPVPPNGGRHYDIPGDVVDNSQPNWAQLLRHRTLHGQHIGVVPYPMWRGRSPAYKDRTRLCLSCYTTYPLPGNAKACPSCGEPPRRRTR